jgi:hypothetical protein
MTVEHISYIDAIFSNNTEKVKYYIDNDYSMPIHGSEKESGFVISCKLGYLETIKLFSEDMKYNDIEDCLLGLMRAIMSNKHILVEYLFSHFNFFSNDTIKKENFDTVFRLVLPKKECTSVFIDSQLPFCSDEQITQIINASFFQNNNNFSKLIKSTNNLYNKEVLMFMIKNENFSTISKNENYINFFQHLHSVGHETISSLSKTALHYKKFLVPGKSLYKENATILYDDLSKINLYYQLHNNLNHPKPKLQKNKI